MAKATYRMVYRNMKTAITSHLPQAAGRHYQDSDGEWFCNCVSVHYLTSDLGWNCSNRDLAV